MIESSSNKIRQEACEWIARLHDSEPSARKRAELKKWVQQSPTHKAELQSLAKMWGELDILTELAVPVEMPRQSGRSMRAALVHLITRKAAIGGFATAALVLLIAVVWQPLNDSDDSALLSTSYRTAIGEQKLVMLPDKSTALLNTNSQLTVDYTDESRNVYLTLGEAHFDVAKNPDQPFLVFVGNGVVRAVGTAFSVRLKSNLVDVTVVEGSVQINTIAATLGTNSFQVDEISSPPIIKSGQSALYDQNIESVESVVTIDEQEIAHKLAWKEGMLQFSGDPLSFVVDEIARYTSVSIVIKDPELRDLRIGGLFKVGETEKMFDALERSFGVRVEHIDDDIVYLSMVVSPTSTD